MDKEYYQKYNKTKKRQKWTKNYYADNKDKFVENAKKWRENNPKRRKEIKKKAAKKYYLKNRDRIRDRQKVLARENRVKCLEYYGGKPPRCNCCGENEIKFLTIDHVDNNGAEHRKEIFSNGRSGNIIQWLIRNDYPAGFQVLCYNCNCAKGFWGKCPHED